VVSSKNILSKAKCKVDGCKNNVDYVGVCRLHYMRHWKTGSYETSVNKRWHSKDVTTVELHGDHAKVIMNRGFYALIDIDDIELVKSNLWYIEISGRNKYAIARINGKAVKMHRLIMGYPKRMCDHINGDGLDNRRKNLRLVTRSQNGRNRKVNKNSKTGFKGVTISRGRYYSRIGINGTSIFLGSFSKMKEAIKAYDAASIRFHREYGRTNQSLQSSLDL